MSVDADIPSPSPVPKGKGRPKAKPKPAESRDKRSLNLSISVDTYERLLIHAMRQTGGNISELVERLAREHLREFHLARTPQRQGDADV